MRLPSDAKTPEERASIIRENQSIIHEWNQRGLRKQGLLPRTRTNQQPERELQQAIIEWLRYHKVCFVRMDVAPKTFMVGNQMVRKPSPLRGWADIIVFIKGKAYHVELKAEHGRQSDEQKEVQKYVTEVGGCEYFLMKSLDELERLIKPLLTKQFVESSVETYNDFVNKS